MPYSIFYVNLSELRAKPADATSETMHMLESHSIEEKDVAQGQPKPYKYCYGFKKDGSAKLEMELDKSVYGIQTNEATLKRVLLQERMDKLILVCTKSVYGDSLISKKLEKRRNRGLEKVTLSYLNAGNGQWTGTLDYFLSAIRSFCKATFPEQEDRIGEILIYPTDDSPEEKDMTNCAITVAKQVIDAYDRCRCRKEKVRLILDSNGGKRHFIIIQIGIIRSLTARGIEPDQILYSDFNGSSKKWGNDPVPILDNKSEYRIFDIVSGIDEFVKYGRVYQLKEYFADSGSGITDVLDSVNRMCEAFLTCFADPMVESVVEVARQINEFANGDTAADPTRLEKYVVEQIRADLGEEMLSASAENAGRAILPLLRWCHRKKFYQQAITLYIAKMPSWYIAKGILTPEVQGQPIDGEETFYAGLFTDCGEKDLVERRTLYGERVEAIALETESSSGNQVRSAAFSGWENLNSDAALELDSTRASEIANTICSSYDSEGGRRHDADNHLPRRLEGYLRQQKLRYLWMCGEDAPRDTDRSQTYVKKMNAILHVTPEYAESVLRCVPDGSAQETLQGIMKYYLAFKILRNNSNHANGRCGSNDQSVLLWLEEEGIVHLKQNGGEAQDEQTVLDYAFTEALLRDALSFHENLLQ